LSAAVLKKPPGVAFEGHPAGGSCAAPAGGQVASSMVASSKVSSKKCL